MRNIAYLLLFFISSPVLAAESLNAADVSWMMVATTLVLFMTIPGIALFYAGMVRKKNVVSVVMLCGNYRLVCSRLFFSFLWGELVYWKL